MPSHMPQPSPMPIQPPPPNRNYAATGPENFSYSASSTAENFSMAQPTIDQHQHQSTPVTHTATPNKVRYEGVTLQAVLNVFGTLTSAAGGLASSATGLTRTVAGGVVTNVSATGARGVLSSIGVAGLITPGRLAGGMASWRVRLADVMASVDNSVAMQHPMGVGGNVQPLPTLTTTMLDAQPPQPVGGAAQTFERAPSNEAHGTASSSGYRLCRTILNARWWT